LSAAEVASAKNDSMALLRRYRIIWDRVKYEPGEIKVVAYDEAGQAVKTQTVKTASTPHHLTITPSVTKLSKGHGDLCFLRINVVDINGNLCPDADDTIRFHVKGAGCYVAASNGDPTNLNDFNKPLMPAFHGQLMAVVSTIGTAGDISFTASADGLDPCTITLHAQ
jgi:beta-galactosidase